MTGIDKTFLDNLRDRLPLSQLIGQKVKLTRAGREYKGCCPFHNEKTPSFHVNDDKGFFHCFGCGAHGDVVGFKMRHDNVSFIEAVTELANLAGVAMPDYKPEQKAQADDNKRLTKLLDDAAKWFTSQLFLPQNRQAWGYVQQRGISPETAEQFRLGYAPPDRQAFITAMRALGHGRDDLLLLGLAKTKEGTTADYAFFRSRIMFPVTDLRGQVVAFGGRYFETAGSPTLPDGAMPPKYLNSPEHPLFQKGEMLYNLAKARPFMGQGEAAVVVEGYMDVISLAQAGVHTAVAPLGTALTETQIQRLWRTQANPQHGPILCFDGDKAGVGAAYRAIDRALPLVTASQTLRFVFLPNGEDPDTIIKRYGRPTWDDLVQQPLGLFDVMWQRAIGQFDAANPTPEAQAQLSHMLHEQLGQIKDNVLRHAYTQALKQKLYEWGRVKNTPTTAKPWQQRPAAGGASNRWLPPKAASTTSVLRPPTMRPSQGQMLAKTWLATMLNHPWALGQFADWFAAIPMPDQLWANLRTALLAWWQDIGQNRADEGDNTLTAQDLEPYLAVNEFEALSAVFLSPATYLHAVFAQKGSAMADVQNGLQEMVALAQQTGLTQDLQQWRQTMGTEPSAAEWDRLIALSQAAAPNVVANDE